jgi:hypothetical protein
MSTSPRRPAVATWALAGATIDRTTVVAAETVAQLRCVTTPAGAGPPVGAAP